MHLYNRDQRPRDKKRSMPVLKKEAAARIAKEEEKRAKEEEAKLTKEGAKKEKEDEKDDGESVEGAEGQKVGGSGELNSGAIVIENAKTGR